MNHIAKDQTLQYVLTVVDDVLKVSLSIQVTFCQTYIETQSNVVCPN